MLPWAYGLMPRRLPPLSARPKPLTGRSTARPEGFAAPQRSPATRKPQRSAGYEARSPEGSRNSARVRGHARDWAASRGRPATSCRPGGPQARASPSSGDEWQPLPEGRVSETRQARSKKLSQLDTLSRYPNPCGRSHEDPDCLALRRAPGGRPASRQASWPFSTCGKPPAEREFASVVHVKDRFRRS